MESAIRVYSNAEYSVRTTEDEDGTVWFVAKDIAQALEYSEESNPTRLLGNVPEIWKGVKRIHTPGGAQNMLCLTEQGVYFFLGRSGKPKALPYQIWIAGEVVPSIHATGSYSVNGGMYDKRCLPDDIAAIRLVLEPAGIKGNQLTLALDKAFKKFTGYSALSLTDTQLVAPVQEQLITPTDIGKYFGVSARKINQVLIDNSYQRKIGRGYEPLEAGEPYAVMLDVNKWHDIGTPTSQLKWRSSIIDELSQYF